MQKKILGRTGLEVSIVGLGGGVLGFPTDDHAIRHYTEPGRGPMMDEDLGVATVIAALEAGATLIDTAPLYGMGGSERIIGRALRERPDLAKRCLVTTKIGRLAPNDDFDWSYERSLKSFADSLARLGMERLEIAYLHDPMGLPKDYVMGPRGAFAALQRLQRDGFIRWIGIAANDPATNADYLETGEFDAAVVPGAWSLLNKIASERIFPAAEKHGTGLVIATPIERGLLVTGPVTGAKYLYRAFSPECLLHVEKIKTLCREWNIPLAAAALRWCTRLPLAASAIPGARTPQEAQEVMRAGNVAIPDGFWDVLSPLVQHWEMERQ